MNYQALILCTLLAATSALPADAAVKKGKTVHKPTRAALRAARLAQAAGPLYASRPEVMEQAQALAQRLELPSDFVLQAIGQARYMPGIAKAILPPAEGVAKNWALYRSRFVEPQRIQAGVAFWQANQASLQRAEDETGVPASIIVGILGVETLYGRNTGNYRVMDALCTLAFDFPSAHPRAAARAAFFQSELEAFLLLTARTHTDPLALRGSYAGALGWPQFMPSSWTRYGVDFDGDGRVDLFNSQADVIGSVAHYFEAFGWKPGMPTHYQVLALPEVSDLQDLLAPDIRPSFSAADLAAHGVQLAEPGPAHPGPLALIALQNGDQPPLYVAGTENFYAITRYNWSSYYALAVIELGQAVAQRMTDMPK